MREAVNGKKAFQMLQEKKFDLLITDWNMPKLDGRELLIKIRSDPRLQNFPVLVVTAESEKAKFKTLLPYSPNGFVLKPFNGRTLQKQIKRIEKEMRKKRQEADRQLCVTE